jgi:hypothetical protein
MLNLKVSVILEITDWNPSLIEYETHDDLHDINPFTLFVFVE